MNFDQLPTKAPNTPVLDRVDVAPESISDLSSEELVQLANELREFLLYSVSTTGGHFGAGLGVVELTIALHHVFNTPDDRIVWDVGHQCYPHKVLTGRRQRMGSMRQKGGLSGFPKRSESEFDTFGVGHSSTSISAAMGMALAARQQGIDRKVVAVIGDGAITGGMAFEALAHAGHERPNMLLILNDNQMSIGHNTGGLASYFARIWATQTYLTLRETSKKLLEHVKPAWDLAKRTEEHMKGMVAPGTLFEELGWHYIGPLDGHDLPSLVEVLKRVSSLSGPQILHIRTIKGRVSRPLKKTPLAITLWVRLSPKRTNRLRQLHPRLNRQSIKTSLDSGYAIPPRLILASLESHQPCAKARAWLISLSSTLTAILMSELQNNTQSHLRLGWPVMV